MMMSVVFFVIAFSLIMVKFGFIFGAIVSYLMDEEVIA
jgi:hypothetical protein